MVRQFRINLNRQEGYAQRMERKRRIRDRITLVVTTLIVLFVVFLTYKNDARMRDHLEYKRAQLQQIVDDIDRLQKEGQNVSREDVMALARLDQDRVLWTKKLNTVAMQMPEDMAITTLEFDRGSFMIRGISTIETGEKDFEVVARYMDRLRNTPRFMDDFRDIKFTESKRVSRDEQEMLSFTITCRVGAGGSIRARRGVSGGSDRADRLSQQLGG